MEFGLLRANEEKKPFTKDERDALKVLNESIRHTDGRYCVALPFRENAQPLKSSLASVEKQLCSIEKRLCKDESLKAAYRQAMNDYVELGFARLATAAEVEEFRSGPEFIIPHHPVVKEQSLSTKV